MASSDTGTLGTISKLTRTPHSRCATRILGLPGADTSGGPSILNSTAAVLTEITTRAISGNEISGPWGLRKTHRHEALLTHLPDRVARALLAQAARLSPGIGHQVDPAA